MRLLLLAWLLAFIAGCGGHEASSDSGALGTATVGPACPVEPCDVPEPPYRGSFLVRQDGAVIRTVRTDELGRFMVRLEPGEYTFVSESGLPLLKPLTVVVRPHAFTTLRLTFDSGIR
jgi:hypothetical protein